MKNNIKKATVKFREDLLYFQHCMLILSLSQISDNHHLKRRRHFVLGCTWLQAIDVTVIGAVASKHILSGVKLYGSTFSYHIRK